MAEDAVDAAVEIGGLARRASPTATLCLHGAPASGQRAAGVDPFGSGRVADPYGRDRAAVEALPGAGRVLQPGLSLTEAEVRYAVRAEFARTVEDVLARRHRALFLDAELARAAAPEVVRIVAAEAGRDADWCRAELTRFAALAEGYRAVGGD
jgi:glycerol-3-phosphate dehydrogenase